MFGPAHHCLDYHLVLGGEKSSGCLGHCGGKLVTRIPILLHHLSAGNSDYHHYPGVLFSHSLPRTADVGACNNLLLISQLLIKYHNIIENGIHTEEDKCQACLEIAKE